jgi:uncharacterized protein
MSENKSPSPPASKQGVAGEDPEESFVEMWESMGMWGPVTMLVALGFVIAYFFFVPPPPPRTIVMASGGEGGGYNTFAKKYREILKHDGFDLQVLPSNGSIQNLKLLREGKVTVAFVQGGTAFPIEDSKILESLGSVYYEPLWVFHRGPRRFEYLKELKGKRLAIGELGSGTRAVALQILLENGINFKDESSSAAVKKDPVEALQSGAVDAIFVVASRASFTVSKLLKEESIHLMDFIRHTAYERRFPFLSGVELSQGMCNLKRNIPKKHTTMIAPAATLVIRKDAHHAIVSLLLKAATDIHVDGDLFAKHGEFPSYDHLDLPMNTEAKKYIISGPNILLRYLPFWLALALDRLKVMLVPLFTLLFPLIKIAPPLYRWRIRSKIFRWYRILREIDQEVMRGGALENPEMYHQRLQSLDEELDKVSVPLSYMEEFYNLRVHIALIDKFIDQRLEIQKNAVNTEESSTSGTA